MHKTDHENKSRVCHICGKEFKTIHSAQHHIYIVHEGNKDFTCEICDKSFGTKRDINS